MPLERLFDTTNDMDAPADLYTRIVFPSAPAHRPYVYINMASTADGKIVIGDPQGSAKGVGGPTDQLLFRRLQRQCDAAFLGSVTLRASHVIYPAETPRFVVTRSGDVPLNNRFFTDAPDRAFVFAPTDLPSDRKAELEKGAHLIQIGAGEVDLAEALRWLRQEQGIRRLLCEGGGALNADLLQKELADELFLTLAPKLKGGARLPTIVGGEGFEPGRYIPLSLLSLYHDGDELYLRYRISPKSVNIV